AKRERSGHSPAFPESFFFIPPVSATPATRNALNSFYNLYYPFKTKKNNTNSHPTIPFCFFLNPNPHLHQPKRGLNHTIINKKHPTTIKKKNSIT
ncbi:hypothetical protein, partial [Enterobacter intestinihominis]